MLSPADLFESQYTPTSNNLTSILAQLREVHPPEDQSSAQMEDQNNHEADADDIILGGDVCNCRKSKCLKLYCQCFNAARVCNILCRCVSCANTESNESGRSEAVKIILDRNPAAFDSKFLSRDLQAQQPAHKSGCKCRKSMCLKKYCECFEASLPCSSACTCVDCHNTINDMSRNAERLSLFENADMEVVPVQATRYNRVVARRKSRTTIQRVSGKKGTTLDEDAPHSPGPTESARDSNSAVANEVSSDEKPLSETSHIIIPKSDVACPSSTSRSQQRKLDQISKPPLPRSKAARPESAFCVEDSRNLINLDQNGSFNGARPTMLSRVVTMKRRRDKVRPGNRASPMKNRDQSDQARWISLGDSTICFDCQPDATSLQSIDFKPVENCFNAVQMFSPMSAVPPITMLAGNQSAITANLQRFVSPNTANVASALSLLSRLPYCQPHH